MAVLKIGYKANPADHKPAGLLFNLSVCAAVVFAAMLGSMFGAVWVLLIWAAALVRALVRAFIVILVVHLVHPPFAKVLDFLREFISTITIIFMRLKFYTSIKKIYVIIWTGGAKVWKKL